MEQQEKAIINKRNFIGIEIDKEYFEIARKRIDATKEEIEGCFL